MAVERSYQQVPLLYKDSTLDWRDLEFVRSTGAKWDWSRAKAAASYLALAEDDLIFRGSVHEGLEGLLTVPGCQELKSGAGDIPGGGFADVANALGELASRGFMPPYSVIAGVTRYAEWHRLYGNSGVLEVEQIQKLVEGGVFQSPWVPHNIARSSWSPKSRSRPRIGFERSFCGDHPNEPCVSGIGDRFLAD